MEENQNKVEEKEVKKEEVYEIICFFVFFSEENNARCLSIKSMDGH